MIVRIRLCKEKVLFPNFLKCIIAKDFIRMAKFIISLLISFIIFIYAKPAICLGKIVNPKETYTYKILEEDISQLRSQYGTILSIRTIGESHFGKKIFAIRMGKGDKHVVMVGAHHGREWMTSSLMMNMLEFYADAYQKNKSLGPFSPAIFDEVSLWFVPMLNPDGVAIQQGYHVNYPPLKRHHLLILNGGSNNFLRWKANGQGIDLNRQYPSGWEELPKEPQLPSYQFYRGEKPFEAKEVRALAHFTKEIGPLMAVAYHSSGREIYWKYKNKYEQRDKKLAWKLSMLTGYELSTPPSAAVGGGYTDWFITAFERPGFTIEICPLVKETSPPLIYFDEEWERNKFVGIFLATEARKLADGAN